MRALLRTWPDRRVLLVAAGLVAAVDLAAAATQVPTVVRVVRSQTTQQVRLVRDADLDPLAAFVPTGALAAAAADMPADATYAIVVADKPAVADPQLIRIVFAFWLLPRRYTPRLADAQWVIAYRVPSERTGVRFSQEIGIGPEISLLQVVR